MNLEKPVNYRDTTWEAIKERLATMPIDDLFALSSNTDIKAATREGAIRALVARGGLLMVELGLIESPELTTGTVFMADEIHEYIIDEDAARQLAGGEDEIAIRYIGGDPARSFSRIELLEALRATKEFDQVAI